jgi:hypothetical protein
MKIVLVSYSPGRAITLQKVLEAQGYTVLAMGGSGDKIYREMKTLAPELGAVVLDLASRPSHTHEVGDALVKTKYLAGIPRLWLDGKDEDRQKVREKLSPRERFVTVDELDGELRKIKENS